jgi:hypothetical protein
MAATLTPAQAEALRKVVTAVLDTIREAGPLGAPGGVIYAALMHVGCTLEQYEQLMGALVRSGRVRREGECYFAVEPAGIAA